MVGSQSMSLHGWRVLTEWSIEHSCMTNVEKSEVKEKWLDSWNAFCQWITDEYGAKYPATRPVTWANTGMITSKARLATSARSSVISNLDIVGAHGINRKMFEERNIKEIDTYILWRDRMDVPSQCTIVRTVG
jgi:hypothetical protein